MPFKLPAQRVQFPAGSVHIFRGPRIVEREELLTEAFSMSGLNFRFRPGSKKLFDTFVTKAANHTYSV